MNCQDRIADASGYLKSVTAAGLCLFEVVATTAAAQHRQGRTVSHVLTRIQMFSRDDHQAACRRFAFPLISSGSLHTDSELSED